MRKEVIISRIKVFAQLKIKGGTASIEELAVELSEDASWVYCLLLPMTRLVEIEDVSLGSWHVRQYSKVMCKLTQEGKKVSDLAYLYYSTIETLEDKLEKETRDFNKKLDKILSPK